MKQPMWLADLDRRIILGMAGGGLLVVLLVGFVYLPVCRRISRSYRRREIEASP